VIPYHAWRERGDSPYEPRFARPLTRCCCMNSSMSGATRRGLRLRARHARMRSAALTRASMSGEQAHRGGGVGFETGGGFGTSGR
jgi:hypothetical protein